MFRPNFSISGLRLLALAIALPVAVLGFVVLGTDRAKSLIAHGPIQVDHADVSCAGCHVDARGSLRQQIQANLFYFLGQRAHPADFGMEEVTSDTCLSCHERPNDRHPIYRFQEPRFVEAVAKVEATNCLGCHSEHEARRVVADVGLGFCSACHEGLEMKDDPLDVPHVTLIADKNWNSCMGCHDFHGNHPVQAPKLLREAASPEAVADYLAQGVSPYGTEKSYKARSEQ